MGVPKFYRWISERYPKINQIVSDHALLPEFDHLYLDMNGIIHGCTHPHDRDISDGLSEREMMLGIMKYLERIVFIVKPKVSLYMAIDGVAPRAKLNQQRSRRFRSAKDLAEATKDQDEATKADVFDSNCITPGTEFLAKVSEVIKYFIRKKIRDDPLWRNLKVIFSGHDIPGEGEQYVFAYCSIKLTHGIFSSIVRCEINHTTNPTRDIASDLIMLGLVTHEPHFTLLREVVDFNMNRTKQKNSLKAVKKFTKESDFQLLHLSVLREYLLFEFVGAESELYDLERCVDDFVLMTFLVGNDFLPHGVLDISEGAFDLLFSIYKQQRCTWGHGNYLSELGNIADPLRMEGFLAAVGSAEQDILEQREDNEADYMKKKRRWDKRDGKAPGPTDEDIKVAEAVLQGNYSNMMEALIPLHSPEDFIDGWSTAFEGDRKDFKGRYYFEKLHFTPIDKEKHWNLCKSYVEGLQWCLAYYYRGCVSWGWFYPYHYAPFFSDLKNLSRMFDEIKFELGAPLTPFQQLMGCLPPASSSLVPQPYRWLMSSTQSPIVKFYPVDFAVDMNGKRNPWEGVNLLPFIDISLLKATIKEHCPPEKLKQAERKRNVMGKVILYRRDSTCSDVIPSPDTKIGLSDIANSCSSVSYFDEDLGLSPFVFEPRLIAGTQIPFPGYPSLGVLPMQDIFMQAVGLNCFGSASKYPTMMLSMCQMPELPPLDQLSQNVLGQSVYVNWPMMHEARVVAISDGYEEFRLAKGKPKSKKLNEAAVHRWVAETDAMTHQYYTGYGVPGSGGVQIGEIKVRLKVVPLQGMKTNPATGAKKKLFGSEEADVPLQLALWQAPAPDPRFIETGPMSLADRFVTGSNVVLTKGKHRGCLGTVVGAVDQKSVGVKVQTMPPEFQFGLATARSVQQHFVSSIDAARVLKVHPGIIGKIMGRLQFEQGHFDLGLNLKTSDGNCVPGYTRKKADGNVGSRDAAKSVWSAGDSVLVVGSRADAAEDDDVDARLQWEYSPKAIRAVQEYQKTFPALFAGLKKLPNERKYDAATVLGPKGEQLLPVIREWLDKHESARIPRSPVTTELLPVEASQAIEQASTVRLHATKKKGFPKEAMLKIPGSALYLEGSTGATDVLVANDLNGDSRPVLGDRVVNLCAEAVPFGARGTVVGIHEAATTGSIELVMDEEFVGGTTLQGHCSPFRGKLCLWSHVLKIAIDEKSPTMSSEAKTAAPQPSVAKILQKREESTNQREKTPKKSVSTTPPRTSNQPARSTPSRSGTNSAGRNRQGAWREARGPPEKGNGFKKNKKTKSGLERWKQQRQRDQISATDLLKKRLGVVSSQSDPSPESRPPQPKKEFLPSQDPASKQLKALLGVKPKQSTTRQHPNSSAKPEHKAQPSAILQREKPLAEHVQQAIPGPPSASTPAEKLLQLLATKQQEQVPAERTVPAGFNFTFVDEGQSYQPPPPDSLPQPNFGPAPIMAHLPQQVNVATQRGPSIKDYPPLNPSKTEPSPPGSSVLVPSVVASKRDTPQ